MRIRAGIICRALGAGLVAFGLFQPDPYLALVVWSLCIQALLATSYSFVGGMGGELHLGHGAFFGLGAYAGAICLGAGFPWWAGLLAAGASGAICSWSLSPLLVRLKGAEFAVCSLCIPLLAATLARNLETLTGGVAGISVPIPGREIPYSCTLLLLMGTIRIYGSVYHSRWGRALRSAGADPMAAAHLGISCKPLRTQALVLGSTLASLAGGIYPLQSGYVSPESAFGTEALLSPVVAALMGGSSSTWGPLLGAVLLGLLQELILVRFPGGTLWALGFLLMASGLGLSVRRGWNPSKV
jgi:branched-chain amino acid transport system permease protein